MRSASVLVPRSASQQSNGPGTAPYAFWMNPMRSARSSRFTTSIPPTMSLWPFRYLVVECSTMSAPSSSGRWKQGVAKVLSTTNRAPARCATSAVARRSHSPIIGFVGVSAKSNRVSGVTAAAMASVSAPSTKANARPSRAHTCVIWRCVPPYTLAEMPQPTAMHCLVVDDEPRLRRVLVRLLEGEGFVCREAGSGTEALELMRHEPVPLVISDLRMPQMDGVTLLREVISRWPDTAVIVVTAVAEVESAVACLQLGALDYVAKPFHLDEVRARVMQALDKRRLILENRMYQEQLEQRVQEQARRIEELSLERLQALVHALEEKDPYLRGHSVRVANAMDQLEEVKGRQFDQGAVQAFLRAFPDAASLPVASPEARPLHLPTPVAVRRS